MNDKMRELLRGYQSSLAASRDSCADDNARQLWDRIEAAFAEQPAQPDGQCSYCLTYNGHQDGCIYAPPAPSDQPAQGEAVAHVVPGVMRCAKCEFRLQRVNLYVGNGTVGAGDNRTEPCPNGCGPLWPVTWEQEARECWKLLVQQHERMQAASAPNVPDIAVPDFADGSYADGFNKGWNVCRAAMLAAAPEIKP